jgi:hypothetical protein
MTIKGNGKYPCSSELHTIFQKIPKEWLEKALQRLDELSVEQLSKFGEKLDVFVIDGSALTGETLVELHLCSVKIQNAKKVSLFMPILIF